MKPTAKRCIPFVRFGSRPERTGGFVTGGGLVRLFDPAKGELIASVHGHLNAVFGIAFSTDGRRLISACGGRDVVKLPKPGGHRHAGRMPHSNFESPPLCHVSQIAFISNCGHGFFQL